MLRTAHVLLGSSAAGTFSQSGIRSDESEMFVVHDSLSCGPLTPIADLVAWTKERLAYWRSIHGEAYDEPSHDLIGNTDVLAAEQIWVWVGTSLADQIALAWLPALLRVVGADPERLSVVQFHKNERGMEIVGLGMLNPKQVAAHPPPTALTRVDLAELELVWRALTSPEPDELMAYLAAPGERLGLLKRALRELPWRYPDSVRGVNAKEERLLRGARLTTKTVTILGDALIADYEAVRRGTGGLDQVGDIWLYAQILRLADSRLREPALEITGRRDVYPETEVRLTAFGERVLKGQANFVEVNGIEDWVAGVHMQSERNRVWFYRDGKLHRAGRASPP